jgi:hypothetical protein
MRSRLLLPIALSATPALGIYPTAPADTVFTSVGKFGGASGVAIAPRWVLTARHIDGTTFELPEAGTFNVVENYSCPFADIRLVKLSASVPAWTPIWHEPLGKGDSPRLSEKVWLVGFGDMGVLRQDGGGYVAQARDGNRHSAVNMVDGLAFIRFSESQTPWLTYFTELDDPNGGTGFFGPYGSIPGEGGVASGDSGGGFFVKRNGKFYLVGTISARGPAPNGGTNWDWGARSFATVLSVPTVRLWIETTMGLRSRSNGGERKGP